MFSIYGISGPVFNGTLEQLDEVRALAQLRAVRRVTNEPEDQADTAHAERPTEEALRAYRAMRPEEIEPGPLYHAEQIMQRPVRTITASAAVIDAWRVLRDHHVRQAPVIDDSKQLVGIVSERNLLTALNIDHGQIVDDLSRQVRDVMTTPVVAATPMTDIRHLAKAMLDHGVDGIPILSEDGHLIGFVSRSDLLRAVITRPALSLWR